MTISNTETSVTVQGNGLTTTFSYTFPMGGSATYAVLTYTDENGDQTTITSSDFSITGVTSSSGGTFTYPLAGSPIATSTSLTLARVLPLVQSAAVGNQGNFYPSVVEGALDYQMMVAQQISAASGTLDAESLFGNPESSSGVGRSVPIGSGLSFSGNTLVVSGISGSGTVTEVDTGTGLTGGPVTGIGTISMATITTGYMLANFSGATAAPQGVQVSAGSGLTFSATTTSLTLSASGGYALITTSTPTATSSVTLTIPQTYTNFEIRGTGRSTGGASPGVTVQMTFNGDSGGNYDFHEVQIANATVGANSAAAQTSVQAGFITWSSSTTNNFGAFRIEVETYTSSVFKQGLLMHNSLGATSVGASWIARVGGGFQWRSTASITSVTLALSAGNWDTGSKISVYGLL